MEQDLPYTVFHPLYMYGEFNGKDCEQWFMDRILRSALGTESHDSGFQSTLVPYRSREVHAWAVAHGWGES